MHLRLYSLKWLVFSEVKTPMIWESAGLSDRSLPSICYLSRRLLELCTKVDERNDPRLVLKLPPKSVLHYGRVGDGSPKLLTGMWLQMLISGGTAFCTHEGRGTTASTSLTEKHNIFFLQTKIFFLECFFKPSVKSAEGGWKPNCWGLVNSHLVKDELGPRLFEQSSKVSL